MPAFVFAQGDTLSMKDRDEMAKSPTFTSWNKAIRTPSKVYYLDLSNDSLTTVSDTIRDMRKIVSLDLSNNRLVMLPMEICDLRYLEELRLSNNQLKATGVEHRES